MAKYIKKRRIYGILAAALLLLSGALPAFAENGGDGDQRELAGDLSYALGNKEGIVAGADNAMKVTFQNQGDMWLKDGELRLILPEQITVYSGAEYQSLGFVSVDQKNTAEFRLTAEKKTKSKSYPVQIQVSGTDQAGSTRILSRTFYVPVLGTDSGEGFSMSDIEIRSVTLPQEAESGREFSLAFQVTNNGDKTAKDLKITVETAEGLLNRTPNTFMERSLAAGESKSYKVALFTLKDAAEKNYSVKITAEPTLPSDEEKENGPVSQYTGILIRPADTGAVKTPRLMVRDYSYGGGFVQAGATFPLRLELYNTSRRELRNIQVTVTAADGVFIPVKAGNALYVDRLEEEGTVELTLMMSVKNDAPQKSAAVDVDMTYEDLKGTEFTAKSTISVAVNQETRLVVDEATAPPDLYVGNQSAVSVNFYNMGKNVLNNLRVNVEGDFDQPQSNTYYVGNMDPGKSDSYDFTFVPRAGGPVGGTITFTYEDGAGVERRLLREFSFTAMEMPAMDDPGMMPPPEEEKKAPLWLYGSVGAALAAVAAAVILRKRHLKKQRDLDLELDDSL